MDHEVHIPQAHTLQRLTDDGALLAMARIGVHFACNAFFLEEGQLLIQAARLNTVPGIIALGEHDLVTPPSAAVALHRAWPHSRLQRIEAAGHASSYPPMAQQLIAATDHFSETPDHIGDNMIASVP
jgi:proline iminopeptidase